MAASRTVTFTEPWGQRSWKVSYDGPYTNDRLPHVEVGTANMKSYQSGQTFRISNLHRAGPAIMWDVEGCKNGTHLAHFTVAFDAKANMDDYN